MWCVFDIFSDIVCDASRTLSFTKRERNLVIGMFVTANAILKFKYASVCFAPCWVDPLSRWQPQYICLPSSLFVTVPLHLLKCNSWVLKSEIPRI